jgi:hypothetical protein
MTSYVTGELVDYLSRARGAIGEMRRLRPGANLGRAVDVRALARVVPSAGLTCDYVQ